MRQKQNVIWLVGFITFLIMIGIIKNYNFMEMLDVKSLGIVLLGTFILTISHYKKDDSLQKLFNKVGWNAFYAGLIATLIQFLALITSLKTDEVLLSVYLEALITLFYGSLFFIFFQWCCDNDKISDKNEMLQSNPYDAKVVYSILTSKDFSQREIHVSLKIMEGKSNKDIAASLYISEATVKKHIQNMFRKCEANNRKHFLELYSEWYENFIK